jgi:ABC-type uncharacterized transport system auxiliary subunit
MTMLMHARATRVVAAILSASTLAGCSEILARRETISYQAGDAVAWNRAVHTIDPWPAASANTTIPVSGRRVVNAIETYENANAAKPTAPPPVTLVPLAPMTPGATP